LLLLLRVSRDREERVTLLLLQPLRRDRTRFSSTDFATEINVFIGSTS
jgi:hypothetical protein